MDTIEKVQLVIDIANGRKPLSALADTMWDDTQPNFIKLAIDHCVQTELQKAAGQGAKFRFKLKEHGQETFTDWKPEISQFIAGMEMGKLRRDHPTAEIAIERQY